MRGSANLITKSESRGQGRARVGRRFWWFKGGLMGRGGILWG